MLDERKIKDAAQSSAAYAKGCQYYHSGRVKMLLRCAQPHTFRATVDGTKLYTTIIEISDQYALTSFSCDCPAFQHPVLGGCKHVVAVLKQLQQDWVNWFQIEKAPVLTQSAQNMLHFFQGQITDKLPPLPSEQVRLVPTYNAKISPHLNQHALEFHIGSDRLYVVKDIPQLINAVHQCQSLTYGKSFSWTPGTTAFDSLSGKLFTWLQEVYEEEKQRMSWGYSLSSHSLSSFGDPRRLRLTNSQLLRFFEIMEHSPFAINLNNQPIDSVRIITGRPSVNLRVQSVSGGLNLALLLNSDVLLGLDLDFRYLFCRQTIFKVDLQFASYVKVLLQCIGESKNLDVTIPFDKASEFFAGTLPALENIAEVDIAPSVYDRFYKEPLETVIYLDKLGEGVSAMVEFRYGSIIINPLGPNLAPNPSNNDKWLLRSSGEEKKILDLFHRFGFSTAEESFIQPDEESYYLFLKQGLPELQALAALYYADNLKLHVRAPGKVSATVRISQSDMLELSLEHHDMSVQELLTLLQSYRLKKRYHRLKDGSFIMLDNTEFETVATLIDQLGLKAIDLSKEVVHLPKYRALYLDSLAHDNSDFVLKRTSAFKKMVQDIREPQSGEYPIPQGIQGKLRDYQKTGFQWLKSLSAYHMGGILADDMGLGKTLQILTLILSEKQLSTQPSLVVAPTSLIFNWQEEAAKFTPALKVTVISGQSEERQEQLQTAGGADLVITSYGMLRRDIELYEDIQFRYCILDEAQHVKNPQTISAQAVKKIKASSYFALTGTPIENSLTELWSIFDFILPGYLRSHKSFVNRFEIPIIKNADQHAQTELRRHINPFILRRMKKAVLQELPPKVESKLVCEMTDEQAKLYRAWLMQARQDFEEEVTRQGFHKSQIKILALLTRLRQLCCHPSLFLDQYQGGSGKLDLLLEILKDAVDGGRRILLFSQFTGMLDIIRNQLTLAGLTFHYLDGATKAPERLQLVHSFNNGDRSIFLISLKAGGTGLNLTGADMVIHYDPWWNPAVEDQATDRAYRIGQQNSVQVYKLIAKDTIEEKIYHLQLKKKELIDSLIQPGENFLTKMSEDEIRQLLAF